MGEVTSNVENILRIRWKTNCFYLYWGFKGQYLQSLIKRTVNSARQVCRIVMHRVAQAYTKIREQIVIFFVDCTHIYLHKQHL